MVWQLVSVSSFLDSLLRISWAPLSQMCAYEITNGTVIVSRYRSVKDRHTALVCGYAVACPCLKGRGDLSIVGVTKSKAIKCSDSSTFGERCAVALIGEKGLKAIRKKNWIIIANGANNKGSICLKDLAIERVAKRSCFLYFAFPKAS